MRASLHLSQRRVDHALTQRTASRHGIPHAYSPAVTAASRQHQSLSSTAAVPQWHQPCSHRRVTAAAAPKATGGSGKTDGKGSAKQQQAAAKQDEEEEEEDGGFLENDEGEGEYEEGEEDEEEGGEFEEGEEDEEGGGQDYAESWLEPDDAPREIATGGTAWGETVLKAAKEVLAQPALQGLELYLFRALPATRKVDIRLDKLEDLYGSPTIDDIERFQRGLFTALDLALGVEAAGDISFEVSSPGAERIVRVPDELQRFGGLPLKVEFRGKDGKDTSAVLLLAVLDEAGGYSSWRLANVRANATVKGRALTKKQLSQRVEIPLPDIIRVRIHVDF